MAKINITPGTANNTMSTGYQTEDQTWSVYQDTQRYVDQAKIDRETHNKKGVAGFRKFASIPDIVAVELLTKYGLDIHDPSFMQDADALKRLKTIITQDFKYLLSH